MTRSPPRLDQTAVSGRLVATAAVPEAARAGLEAMRAGGNAFDAVVAACAVEGVWLPMKCGLGGDLVALAVEAGGPPRALVSIGAGVAALAPGAWPETTGPSSIGVPGAPAGYLALAALGRLTLGDLLAPAIAMAERGVRWMPVAADLTREAAPLLAALNGGTPFLPGGEPPRAGMPLHLPGLAEAFRLLERERDGALEGALGRAILDRLAETGALLAPADLAQRPAAWHAPAELPRPGGGVLSATPLPTQGPLLVEALRLCDRGMAAPEAFLAARAGFRSDDMGGTSVVTAADDAGNAVVVVHSNSFPQYGSGVVVGDLDLVLNNRPGRGFTLDRGAGHWNAPRPGRVPFTTLHAWSLARGGRRLLGATPGGADQAPWNLQAILALEAAEAPFDADLAVAVSAPRWRLGGLDAPVFESDHPDAGPDAARVAPLSLRSAEQVVSISAPGAPVRAAADPRIGAFAVASG